MVDNKELKTKADAYSNTYWNHKGRYQELVSTVEAEVPVEGAVKGSTALEKYRKAANAYYDLYNNGGMNRAQLIRSTFGISCSDFKTEYLPNFAAAVQKVEAVMDERLLAAYVEIKNR